MKKTCRAMQIARPGVLELVERETPQPDHGEVLIEVEACGLCGADAADIRTWSPQRDDHACQWRMQVDLASRPRQHRAVAEFGENRTLRPPHRPKRPEPPLAGHAILREHTRNGLLAARQEGRIGGRRPKLTARQQQEVVRLVGSGEQTAADAARLFNVHPSTIAQLLAKARLGSQA